MWEFNPWWSILSFSFLNPVMSLCSSSSSSSANLQVSDLPYIPTKEQPHLLLRSIMIPSSLPSSLLRDLVAMSGPSFLLFGLVSFVNMLVGFIPPLILKSIVEFVDEDDEDMKLGWTLILLIFLPSLISTFLSSQFSRGVYQISSKTRSYLILRILDQILSLPSYLLNKVNKNDKELRDLSTLITVDSQKVGDYICHMNDIWIIPIQVFFINLLVCFFNY